MQDWPIMSLMRWHLWATGLQPQSSCIGWCQSPGRWETYTCSVDGRLKVWSCCL